MNPNVCKDEDKVERVIAKMKVTMMTDDQLQTMNGKIQEGGDTMTSDQLRTMITEIQEGGGEGGGRYVQGRGHGAVGPVPVPVERGLGCGAWWCIQG